MKMTLFYLNSKKTSKYQIAKVVECSGNLLGIKYLKKVLGNAFLYEHGSIYEIEDTDTKLPPPRPTEGTKRRNGEI